MGGAHRRHEPDFRSIAIVKSLAYNGPMLEPRRLNRMMVRHRRATALIGAVVALGIAGLSVHAALPEHHGHDGSATICIAALAIATLAVIRLRKKWCLLGFGLVLEIPRMRGLLHADPVVPFLAARAGPHGPFVLRR